MVLREGEALDDSLEQAVRSTIRQNATPRHVPAKIIQVPEIPRTLSGKIIELAVREVVHGRPVNNVDALANLSAQVFLLGRHNKIKLNFQINIFSLDCHFHKQGCEK